MTSNMKKITALSSLIILSAFVFFTNTTQAEFVAGKNYTVIDKPVETSTGTKVEVRELFWYFCPHCFSVHPLLDNWLQTMDPSAQLVLQPAVFPGWEYGASFYYVLEELGEVNRLHGPLFDAIHVQKLNFKTQQPIGLMSAIFLSEYASKSVRDIVKPLTEILAGIPTVVYGFFAVIVVAPFIRNTGSYFGIEVASESALAAGLVMGVMIIPFVSSISDDVIMLFLKI